jgi:hypothetical protein
MNNSDIYWGLLLNGGILTTQYHRWARLFSLYSQFSPFIHLQRDNFCLHDQIVKSTTTILTIYLGFLLYGLQYYTI